MNNWGSFTTLLSKTIQSAERSLDKVFEAEGAKNAATSAEKNAINSDTPAPTAPINSDTPAPTVPINSSDPAPSAEHGVTESGPMTVTGSAAINSSSDARNNAEDSTSTDAAINSAPSAESRAEPSVTTGTEGQASTEAKNSSEAPHSAAKNSSEASPDLRAQLSLVESKLHAASVILSERERQLEARAQEQGQLQQENELLRASLRQQRGADGLVTFDSLTAEFSQRLGSLERKLRDVTRERDVLKRQVAQPAAVTPVSASDSALVEQLQRDNRELKHEGLQLARELGDREKQLKRLRATSAEEQHVTRQLRERLALVENSLAKTTEKLTAAEELTAKYESTVSEFKSITQSTARQFEEKEKVSNSALDQLADLKHALETAWRDLAEERKARAETQREHVTALRELETRLREEQARDRREHVTERDRLEQQWRATVDQLRESLAQARDSSGELAENYQREITEERNKVLQLETDLREAQSLTLDSTRPLLREVQQLQTRLQQLQTQHVTAEQLLRSKALAEEQRAVTAVNEARDLQNILLELRKELAARDSEIEAERRQHRETVATNKAMSATAAQTREHVTALTAQCTALQQQLDALVSESTKKEVELNHVIAAQKMKLDDLAAQLAEQRQLLAMQTSTINSAPLPTPPQSRARAELPPSVTGDTWPHAITVEKLTRDTQQRETELQRLHAELTNQRAETARLSEHVLALSGDLETVRRENGTLRQGEARVRDLETRYLAALEMLGEKSERVEEMSGDLSEFKRLYKQQINALCGQIEELTRRNRELEARSK